MIPRKLRKNWLGAHLNGVVGPGMDEMHFGPTIHQQQIEAAVRCGIIHLAQDGAVSFPFHPGPEGEFFSSIKLNGLTGLQERILLAIESKTFSERGIAPDWLSFASIGCLKRLFRASGHLQITIKRKV